MPYNAAGDRYDKMIYRRCGKSGIKLPAVSIGMWHNFGWSDSFENQRRLLRKAFDLGITHFDMANNYGPPGGAAEENFGRLLKLDFQPYRDELIISSKAGYGMWPGPYGNYGSKKYIIASCDQSLKRTGLEYFDIFYHHAPDPETPIEESMDALIQLIRQGKALYVGISNYRPAQAQKAINYLKANGVHLLIHQPCYNMFDRWIEDGLQDLLVQEGVGIIAFSPLAQGTLTDRYLNGIPEDSRAARPGTALSRERINDALISKVRRLNEIAQARGQSLAQMALAWILRTEKVTSVLIGASKTSQIEDNVGALKNLSFTADELEAIDRICKS